MKIGNKSPSIGDEQTFSKFAFIPTKIDGQWIWLEPFKVTYKYVTEVGYAPGWASGEVDEVTDTYWKLIRKFQ